MDLSIQSYGQRKAPISSLFLCNQSCLLTRLNSIEQCFVIMMGSIPPLRAVSKIQFPSLRSLGYSMRNMLSTRSRTVPTDDQFGSATHIEANGADKDSATRARVYENLELSASHASGGETLSELKERDGVQGRGYHHQNGSGLTSHGGIQRSDAFTVSYGRPAEAREDV